MCCVCVCVRACVRVCVAWCLWVYVRALPPLSSGATAMLLRARPTCRINTACGPAAVGASAPEDYDPSPANDASHDAELAQWRKAAAAQGPQVDAIFTSSPTANPKSIAIT